MKVTRFDSDADWLKARMGKITGSRLKDVIPKKRGEGRRQGFYELIAERLAIDPTDMSSSMERGHELEKEAIERYEKATGLEVDTSLVLWQREDMPEVAISPDGVINPYHAVEVKCLGSARHVEAAVTGKVPEDYRYQAIQYFAVNDDLERLDFVFYDPRLKVKDFFFFTLSRQEYQAEVDEALEVQKEVLESVERVINDLSF